jgi:hypothetical protein
MGISAAHLLRDIGTPSEIEESSDDLVEGCQDQRSRAFADLRPIFAQGHITPPGEPVFDGPRPAHEFSQA